MAIEMDVTMTLMMAWVMLLMNVMVSAGTPHRIARGLSAIAILGICMVLVYSMSLCEKIARIAGMLVSSTPLLWQGSCASSSPSVCLPVGSFDYN